MRFAILDHGGKSVYLRQRLIEAGHTQSERIDDTDVLILDCDWPWANPRPQMIEAAVAAGAKVALYPHGGMPVVFSYDGLAEPHPGVSLRLEHGPGHIEIARLFGAESRLNQHAPGWLFTPTAAFSPLDAPGRVLFAPMHPNIEAMHAGTNGIDPAPKVNIHVYRQLLKLGLDLTVSVVGPAHFNGIWPHPRARFVFNPSMSLQVTYQLVADADVVVAAGTVGAMAVAMGKPTVMLGQSDYSDYIGGKYVRAHHAELYEHMSRYPLDAEFDPLEALIAKACAGDAAAAEWREAFVPEDGTAGAIRLLENLVGELLPEQAKSGEVQNASVGGVTARAGVIS